MVDFVCLIVAQISLFGWWKMIIKVINKIDGSSRFSEVIYLTSNRS